MALRGLPTPPWDKGHKKQNRFSGQAQPNPNATSPNRLEHICVLADQIR